LSGPQRRTLEAVLAVCGDEALFSPLADGRVILTAPRQRLEEALGIGHGSLWNRIQTLCRAGLASDDGQLVLHLDAIQERIRPRVVSLPTRRTRQYQAVLEQHFETSVAADGTPAFVHPDGRPATLSEIATATGTSSRGTAHRHLRRIQSSSTTISNPTTAPHDLVLAARTAIDSLAALGSEAMAAGLPELASTAFEALDEIARTLLEQLTTRAGLPDAAANAARSQTRPDAGLRAPKRGTNAAVAPPVSLENEDEYESTHSHDAEPRAPKRGTNAASNGSQDAVPPDARAFENLPDWDPEDWPGLVAPLATTWAERTGKELRIDSFCVDATQVWPKAYVRRAITLIVDDLNAGRHINNPGGLLASAAREGKLRYFPTTPPHPATDPDLSRARFLTECRTRALERLAGASDPFGLANAVVGFATVKDQPDLEALAVMVEAAHTEIADPATGHDFDVEVMSLLETQLAWSNVAVRTIDDVIAALPDRRKAHQ